MGHEVNGIEELLRLRSQLDQELHSKYTREVSILFTDIKGSTSYFEKRGDLAGRAMVQTHNDLLFPVITRHGGKIIKTIGDAIMASFDLPADAAQAAVDMQMALEAHNRGRTGDDRINVRIGVNHGPGIVEKDDVFGDVVNVAARIESLADGGEILVSGSVHKAIRGSDDLLSRYHTKTEVKGKGEPIEVYKLVWKDDMDADEAAMRISSLAVRGSGEAPKTLTLDFTRVSDTLKLAVSERKGWQVKTLEHYEEKTLSDSDLAAISAETVKLLKRANNRGMVSKEIFGQLKEVGQRLFDLMLTPKAKTTVSSSRADFLLISMDDRLVQVPWEILHDGEEFICLRFAMGRAVSTRQSVVEIKKRPLSPPLKMLVLSDPRADLPSAYKEGIAIRDELDRMPREVIANLKSGPVGADYVRSKLRNYDMVHYAGHADYDLAEPSGSGWLLQEGKLSAKDVLEMSGAKPMPALVFSNACHSGQTGEWSLKDNYGDEIYGLANAFLLAGVDHYIGTFWEILDEPSASFAVKFYTSLMQGEPVGEAMRLARMRLVELYGRENIVWASYMLYGDPAYVYRKEAARPAAEKVPSAATVEKAPEPAYALAGGEPRASLGVAVDGMPAPSHTASAKSARPSRTGAIAAGLVATAIAAGGYYFMTGRTAPVSTGPAAVTAESAPSSGATGSAGSTGEQSAGSNRPMPSGPSGSPSAPEAGPTASGASSGEPQYVAALKALKESRQSDQKRKRVRALAHELVARYKANPNPAPVAAAEGGKAGPVTLSILGFTDRGASSAVDGEGEYLVFLMQDRIAGDGRINVVERELMEEVLTELDMSSSELADKQTALRLGRILSARYIATGSLTRSGGEYRASVRVIETETTSIKASVSATGKGEMDVEQVAGKLADGLVARLVPGKI
ncbi:MAG: CHAT domain-containing protein [Nitrospirae bacterium]|nr:CHAT domain-containing protein [Nitrospirota bacterium]